MPDRDERYRTTTAQRLCDPDLVCLRNPELENEAQLVAAIQVVGLTENQKLALVPDSNERLKIVLLVRPHGE